LISVAEGTKRRVSFPPMTVLDQSLFEGTISEQSVVPARRHGRSGERLAGLSRLAGQRNGHGRKKKKKKKAANGKKVLVRNQKNTIRSRPFSG